MRHAREDYNRIQDPSGKIPEDEPVFIIRGQDILGPIVLREYAAHAQYFHVSDDLIQKVLEHANAMEQWQKTIAVKVPDL